jgi:hypothetical protein
MFWAVTVCKLLLNIDTSVPDYTVTFQSTVIFAVNAVRPSDLMFVCLLSSQVKSGSTKARVAFFEELWTCSRYAPVLEYERWQSEGYHFRNFPGVGIWVTTVWRLSIQKCPRCWNVRGDSLKVIISGISPVLEYERQQSEGYQFRNFPGVGIWETTVWRLSIQKFPGCWNMRDDSLKAIISEISPVLEYERRQSEGFHFRNLLWELHCLLTILMFTSLYAW